MLPLELGGDATDDARTYFRISRKLAADIAQKLITVTRRNRPGGFHHGGKFGIADRGHGLMLRITQSGASRPRRDRASDEVAVMRDAGGDRRGMADPSASVVPSHSLTISATGKSVVAVTGRQYELIVH
jgi:hypothetical protein